MKAKSWKQSKRGLINYNCYFLSYREFQQKVVQKLFTAKLSSNTREIEDKMLKYKV